MHRRGRAQPRLPHCLEDAHSTTLPLTTCKTACFSPMTAISLSSFIPVFPLGYYHCVLGVHQATHDDDSCQQLVTRARNKATSSPLPLAEGEEHH